MNTNQTNQPQNTTDSDVEETIKVLIVQLRADGLIDRTAHDTIDDHYYIDCVRSDGSLHRVSITGPDATLALLIGIAIAGTSWKTVDMIDTRQLNDRPTTTMRRS